MSADWDMLVACGETLTFRIILLDGPLDTEASRVIFRFNYQFFPVSLPGARTGDFVSGLLSFWTRTPPGAVATAAFVRTGDKWLLQARDTPRFTDRYVFLEADALEAAAGMAHVRLHGTRVLQDATDMVTPLVDLALAFRGSIPELHVERKFELSESNLLDDMVAIEGTSFIDEDTACTILNRPCNMDKAEVCTGCSVHPPSDMM